MVSLKGSVLFVVSALSLALAAPAQEGGTLNVPGDLVVGEEVTITYFNPEFADDTVLVRIESGGIGETEIHYAHIQLDEQGEGQTVWEVEDWYRATFSAKSAERITRGIQLPKN